ncbi:BTAD domain-containing putative transcriptional regulator [Kutzneria kofuensis]|uniref:Putative ATPase/DNA-binding SARP family transcriptional activator n=1 Tax=Kutzneria kofuensis TaxID=103725 RepID=A0A7W9KDL9_9PSEU|nr:BTAD domain-containing putative transcriptional regulator [Kutzneria kofuensis]MBB5889864.1 putative ATPase/DNA-binding SARP family transcriptional activator [Kutzneria kofuensis]
MEVAGPGGQVDLRGRGQRTLIARLALQPGTTMSQDTLIKALWPQTPPPTAVKTLHSHMARLRIQLRLAGVTDVIATRDPGYVLLAEPEEVDATRFENLVAAGHSAVATGQHELSSGLFRAALTLWRGEPLTDCRPGEWASAAAVRLGEIRLAAAEDLIGARLALGEHITAIGELESLVTQHPFRERLWELLILALYRSGRQADALAAFHRARATLVDELGIEPGRQLRRLEAAVLTADPMLDLSAAATVPVADPTPADRSRRRVPVPLTRLVDRAADTARTRWLLDERRLVTLTGPGGCGKTRLAIAVASGYETGELGFVDLVSLTDSALVPQSVADAFGLPEQAGRSVLDTVADHVRDRPTLLVLDNCEHLVRACAHLVRALLSACPALHVLATSREPLHVPGELVYTVRPLPTPDPEATDSFDDLACYDAVQLFVDRAQEAGAHIRKDGATARALATICASLDGLPLAIELAAARAAALPLSQIAEHLRDRFLGLCSGGHGARPQHRTLHATVKWSYDLLTPDERALFRSLAVFAGGFELPAVAALWPHDNAVDLLGRLVEKSLVTKEPDTARYRLLDTIRHFAAAQLTDAELARARRLHAEYHLGLAEQAERHLCGAGAVQWLERLAADHENLRTAVAWALARPDPTPALRLTTALIRYCRLRGHYGDCRDWLTAALELPGQAPAALRAKAFAGAAVVTFLQCDYDPAVLLAEQSLLLYEAGDDQRGLAFVRSLLGSICREQGDYARALDYHQSALRNFQGLDDEHGIAHALHLSAFTAWLRGDLAPAERWAYESLRRSRKLGDAESVSSALKHLGAVAHYRGDNKLACRLLLEARALSERTGCREGIAWALNLLGLVHHATGSAEAEALLERSLAAHRELGDRSRTASVLETLAAIACDRSAWTRAADLLSEATAIRAALGIPVPPCEFPLLRRTRAALGAAEMSRSRECGG